MGKTIRWAVCGLGRISHTFMKAAGTLDSVKVTTCVSSSKERAESYKQKYALETACTYEELALDPYSVDAVYICTNMSDHHKNALTFLNAGIPVLLEKSVTLNYAQAKELVDCAEKNRTPFMEAMWTRFLPATKYVRELLDSGALGKIKLLSGGFETGLAPKSPRVRKKELGGGSVLDLAVYPVSYAQMLLGYPDSIETVGKVKDGVDVKQKTRLMFGSVEANLTSSITFPSFKDQFTITCENGEIILPAFHGSSKVIVKKDGKKEVKVFDAVSGFKYEIEHFNSLVLSGEIESPIMPHTDTLEVMKILTEMNRQLGVEFQYK